jgi:hypothetical protein
VPYLFSSSSRSYEPSNPVIWSNIAALACHRGEMDTAVHAINSAGSSPNLWQFEQALPAIEHNMAVVDKLLREGFSEQGSVMWLFWNRLR